MIFFIVEAIAAIIIGITTAIELEEDGGFLAFLGITVGGIGACYIIYLFITAFGELVEDTRYIADNINERKAEPQPSGTHNSWQDSKGSTVFKPQQKVNGGWTCKQCGKKNASYIETCGCGAGKPN